MVCSWRELKAMYIMIILPKTFCSCTLGCGTFSAAQETGFSMNLLLWGLTRLYMLSHVWVEEWVDGTHL